MDPLRAEKSPALIVYLGAILDRLSNARNWPRVEPIEQPSHRHFLADKLRGCNAVGSFPDSKRSSVSAGRRSKAPRSLNPLDAIVKLADECRQRITGLIDVRAQRLFQSVEALR